uniref:hypothetical protein n=1 Tax=uncultured Dokdonia sp. TaxID=575653 RepID=UPI00260C4147
DQAVNYISNWTKKSMSEIDEITSFNGQRLRYISYPSSLIKHIGSLPSTNTNIAWGIDEKGKITTVIIPIPTNKNELLEVFDNGKPCPPSCPTHC